MLQPFDSTPKYAVHFKTNLCGVTVKVYDINKTHIVREKNNHADENELMIMLPKGDFYVIASKETPSKTYVCETTITVPVNSTIYLRL